MTFEELTRQVSVLSGAGENARALGLLNRWQGGSAAEAGEVAYLRLRLFTRLGQYDQALAALQDSLEAGYWYSPRMLRRDEELVPLRGLAEFERLIALCDERRAEAQKGAAPSRVTLAPSPPVGDGMPLCIALHGNISTARLEEEHWRPLSARGWLVALPQSSQVGAPDRYVWNDREWAVREVKQHLAEVQAAFPVDPGRVVVGGMSVGAGLAIWLALSGLLGARGFIAVAPWLADAAELRPLLEARVIAGLRGYIIVGDCDTYSYKVSQEVRALLSEFGIPCELEVRPGHGHGYPDQFTPSLEQAMRFIEGERPDLRPWLGREVTLLVDRPLGSRHPQRESLWYPINYGYIPDTISGDGEPIDAYLIGVFEPVAEFTGRVIGLIRRRDDVEDKLVVAPPGRTFTVDQIRALVEFQERFFDSEILVP